MPLSSTFADSGEFAHVSAKLAQDFGAESEEQQEEFSFACANPQGSPISADELFHNGQIRPIFPVLAPASPLRSPLRKLFVEQRGYSSSESDGARKGPCCEWFRKTAVEASKNGRSKKSNSTGFSKLWRFRDLKLRSNSDGTDAFVFLNPPAATPGDGEEKSVVAKRGKGEKRKTASSAHEKHYVMNRARKESNKRKSYLPYRQNLVGFFASVNGFSSNLHPF